MVIEYNSSSLGVNKLIVVFSSLILSNGLNSFVL